MAEVMWRCKVRKTPSPENPFRLRRLRSSIALELAAVTTTTWLMCVEHLTVRSVLVTAAERLRGEADDSNIVSFCHRETCFGAGIVHREGEGLCKLRDVG